MKINKRKKLVIINSIIVVVAVLISVMSTSIYYKKFYVGDNQKLLLDNVYDELDKNYYQEVDKDVLYAGAVKGMVEALDDPYTTYMNTEEAKEFEMMLENEFVGIGVQIEQTLTGVYVTKVYADSPAESAGVAEGDLFSTVDGEDVLNSDSDTIASKVRGPKGSTVTIGFKRAGSTEDVVLEIKRDAIELEDLKYSTVGKKDNVGYIRIYDFTGDIHSQFKGAYKNLVENGIDALIIDVRGNGGGYLGEVYNIVDMFVDDSKPIFQEKRKDREPDPTYGNKGKEDIELAILIDGGSASASELLAASLSEINGNKLIGTTTFGKGTAQTTKKYSDGSSLKYTYAQWLTPDGNWINEVGVSADYEVELNKEFYYRKVLVESALKFDQVNEQIENAQLILTALGYNTRVDGYFGDDTVTAVKNFQRDNGLAVTGEIDGATANKINEKFASYLENYEVDNQIVKAIEVLGYE